MDIDSTTNDLNLAREREVIVEAAAKIAAVLAQAPLVERPELVKAVDETLNDAGVAVIDTNGSDEDERRGKHHDYTRLQIIRLIATREQRWRRKQTGLSIPRRLLP